MSSRRSGFDCSRRVATLSSCRWKRVASCREDHARNLRFVDLHAQHAAAGQGIVERHLGLHVPVTFVHLDDRVGHRARRLARDRLAQLPAVGGKQLRRAVDGAAVDDHGGQQRRAGW